MAVLALLMPLLLQVPLPVEGLDYSKDQKLSLISSSFLGEKDDDQAGWSVARAGDVNGDGLDDILIGAPRNAANGERTGKAYLFFGKAAGWSKEKPIKDADASFIGEASNTNSGCSVAGAGDINGDGFDDILIGSSAFGHGQRPGEAYIIFGKAPGWTRDMGLSKADASYVASNPDDYTGSLVAGAGDVNGDGFDDILIAGGAVRYMIFGRATGWAMDTVLSLEHTDVQIENEPGSSISTQAMASAGDVNGDGLDDILVGLWSNDCNGDASGKSYLVLGRTTRWNPVMSLSDADATFCGEHAEDYSGNAVAGAGDVNGDGLDDILIGAFRNQEGGDYGTGQTYIIFGKTTGWSTNMNLSKADASYWGEAHQGESAASLDGAGDVNGDGYDDIIIGADRMEETGDEGGEVYIVLGKVSGWKMDENLSNADASFVAEAAYDSAGLSVAGAGDVNGDGNDDILIGAPAFWSEFTTSPGEVYLISPEINPGPPPIISVKAYADPGFTAETSVARENDTVFIELKGKDPDSGQRDTALVDVSSTAAAPNRILLGLLETGAATGMFRGKLSMTDRTSADDGMIRARGGDTVTVSSVQDATKKAVLSIIGPPGLYPDVKGLTAVEDQPFSMPFTAEPPGGINWTAGTNASWATWNQATHTLAGTPDNGDVGTYWADVNITGPQDLSDEHNYTLTVINVPPDITTPDITQVVEGSDYAVDYNCTDDGQGTVTWHLTLPTASLSMDPVTGVLKGSFGAGTAGQYQVNVGVDDGNSGWDWSNFTLTVAPNGTQANHLPKIISQPPLNASVGYQYEYQVVATDEDAGDVLIYSILAGFPIGMTMDSATGLVRWTPNATQKGVFAVMVEVTDGKDQAVQWFNITVTDIPPTNHRPVIDPIADQSVDVGTTFSYTVKVSDADPGDVLTLKLVDGPNNMTLSPAHVLSWSPGAGEAGNYTVILSVSDGKETATTQFVIRAVDDGGPGPVPDGSTESEIANNLWVLLIVLVVSISIVVTAAMISRGSQRRDKGPKR